MEVARTSMIHAAAPHFLWPFAVWYAAHQLNLWPRVSLTGVVGDASMFRVWGSRAFVPDTSADKLTTRAIPCVFLGFVPDTPGWQFYHPTSRRVFPSQDVTFSESVPFYHFFPYRSAPPPPPPLFLAPGPPPVDPLPPQGLAPSGVSQVDPLPGSAPVQVAVGSCAAPGAASGGAASGGASPRVSPQQLREWFVRRAHLRSGASGAGGAGDAGTRGAEVIDGAGGTGGARTKGTGAAGNSGVGGAGAGDPTEFGAGGTNAGGAGAGGAEAAGDGAVDPGAGGSGGTVRPRPYFVPLLQQVLGVPSSTGLPSPLLCPSPDQSLLPLQPTSPLPAPSPYTEQSGGLTERREHASRPVSPVRTARRVPRLRPPPVPGTHIMALRPSSDPLRVPLSPPPESSLPEVLDPEYDHARVASPTVACLLASAVIDPSLESAAASALVAELLDFAAACSIDYATSLVAESTSASPSSVAGECALGTDVLEDRQEDFECLAAVVLQRFGFQFSSPQPTPLSTSHSLLAPPSDESVEPSGPYPELVGCLMYLMTCTRPDLPYPLSLLARYVSPGRHRKLHWDAAKRVLRYLCSTLGMGLVLGGRGPFVLSGHANASWVDDSATQRSSQGYTFSLGSGSVSWRSIRSSSVLSSSCEPEIYAGAMAAQELRLLTYLLIDLGE
ncbi:unnamed protein product [Closterium sp. NIES-53]